MPTKKTPPAPEEPVKKPASSRRKTPPVPADEAIVPPAPLEPVAPAAPIATPAAPEPVLVSTPAVPPPVAPPLQPQPMSPGDEHTWAMLSHLSVLLNLVTGFFGPIGAFVIYLVYKDRSRYVAYHAMQSLVFQLIWWVGGGVLAGLSWALSGMLAPVFIGLLCMPFACIFSLFPLGGLIYGIVGAVQTSQGQDFKYWLVGDWVRGTLTG